MTTKLAYILRLPAPQTHYAEIEMQIFSPATIALPDGFLDLKMPVWTPGSYLVREYSRMVEGVKVEGVTGGQVEGVTGGEVGNGKVGGQVNRVTGGQEGREGLQCRKINKNTWRVLVGKEQYDKLIIHYAIYGFELTVRTNYIDQYHAALQGAPTFLYIDQHLDLPAHVQIEMPEGWQTCLTALTPVGKPKGKTRFFEVPDYHTLVDSPIALGNYDVFDFEAVGIPHKVGIYGLQGYDQTRLASDMQKIVASATDIMGENPCDAYTFMTIFTQKSRGGLEHLFSTALIAPREEYFKPEGYEDYLTLIAHEYFHLWNVKRLCPQPLDNFNYEAENYTTLLWQAEGFTSYYENIIMLKAGLISPESFIQKNVEHLDIVENQYGRHVLSVADSSLDAWIKLYRPHENSANTSISYYTKGAIIAMLLDWDIIRFSEGERNLDDVMRYLYQRYYKTEKRGFTEEEILEAIVAVIEPTQSAQRANTQRYFEDFFQAYIYGTAVIPYWAFFKQVGLAFQVENKDKNAPSLGIELDKNVVKFVKRESSAFYAGLSAGDQVVSLNGTDIAQYNDWLKRQQVGEEVSVTFLRDGLLREVLIIVERDNTQKFTALPLPDMTNEQARNYNKWLRK
jgi:predicted metalloprotease with PDZ domain